MRILRLSIVLIALLTVSTTLHAQNDERALAAGIDTIISDKTLDYTIADRVVDDIFAKHGKSAYLAYRIAKCYYQYLEVEENRKIKRDFLKKDTARAFKYINYAIAIDPKYPDSYILASDIIYKERAGGRDSAMIWLDKGISLNPKNESLYIAQAELLGDIDVERAIEKMQELAEQDSSIPVNLLIARMLWNINNKGDAFSLLGKVAEYYAKADINMMSQGDLEQYCWSLFYGSGLENKNSRACQVAEYGLKKYSHSLTLCRFFLRTLPGESRFSDGPHAFENVMHAENKSSTPNAQARDYMAYGACLVGLKRYDEALIQYDKVLSMDDAIKSDKESTQNLINGMMRQRVEDFVAKKQYEEAVSVYGDFFNKRKEEGKLDDAMFNNYAQIYLNWSYELEGDSKIEAMMNADKIYEEGIRHSQSYDIYFSYMRVRIAGTIDPGYKKPETIRVAQQMIDLCMSKAELKPSHREYLADTYMVMAGYEYNVKKNKKKALEYANMALDNNPTQQYALKLISIIG